MKDMIDAKLSSMEDKMYKKAFIGSYKLLSTLALVIRLALARILFKNVLCSHTILKKCKHKSGKTLFSYIF